MAADAIDWTKRNEMMATVIPFPDPTTLRSADRQSTTPGEVVIFPGVRVVYHDNPSTVDLSCRIQAKSGSTKP